MSELGTSITNKRSRSASKAARTKAVKVFDARIKEIEELVKDVRSGKMGTTKANTIIRAYSCMLDWTKAKREVYLEVVLAADIRSLREELKREPEDAA
jgi:hypothetical protein